MNNLKVKRKNRSVLSQGQNRLLKEALKSLLGQGLVQSYPEQVVKGERSVFLKDALNPKILDAEWFS